MSKIIAEIGINWCGDLQIAREMIFQSKRAGADTVKFQMFNEKIIKDSKHKKELSEMILTSDSIRYLSEQARMLSIKFGISVMYYEGFDILEKLKLNNLDFIKIRYADRENHELANRAVEFCRKNDIPLIVSVRDFFMGSKLRYNTSVIYSEYSFTNYMYCIPEYPPEISEIKEDFISGNYFHGYSNHYPSKFVPMIAVMNDVKFIEIHVKRKTHNNASVSLGYTQPQIDENVSIDFDDLEDVCKFRDLLLQMR